MRAIVALGLRFQRAKPNAALPRTENLRGDDKGETLRGDERGENLMNKLSDTEIGVGFTFTTNIMHPKPRFLLTFIP